MSGVRVLRIIEYRYADAATAEDDMSRWTHSLNTKGKRMQSATLPFELIEWHEGGDEG